MKRIALFASGSGSNVERIAAYFSEHEAIEIAGVLSNRRDAPVFERCQRLGLPAFYFNRKAFLETEGVVALLRGLQTDLVVLAGFLWKVPPQLLQAFPQRIVNIHPALLPDFGGKGMYGMRVHEAVVQSGAKRSGITIHYVNEAYDEGAIIHQASLELADGESPESLARRIHELEYEHYPQVLEKLLCP